MTIQVGDRLPDVPLSIASADGPKPTTSGEFFKGKRVALFAVPGAFTPTCSARHLPSYVDKASELKRQGVTAPRVGETTLIGQKLIELAGDAANGPQGRVGLTVDAPIPAIRKFGADFKAKYNYVPDHNGIKGYLSIYVIKAVTEKMGKVDAKDFAKTLHGMTITAAKEPGILMDVTYDQNGDIDRQGFLVEVKDGKQVVTKVLPKLGK